MVDTVNMITAGQIHVPEVQLTDYRYKNVCQTSSELRQGNALNG